MSQIRFVHAADLHLDSQFSGLLSHSAEVANVLRDATFAAYSNVIDLCLREKVDALLIAGDVYDSADRSLRAQLRFYEGLRRLGEAGIRSFVCHGNHDPLDGWEARLTPPSMCHRFGPEVEAAPLDPGDPGKATVYGISYPRRDVRENLVPRFQRHSSDGFAIGLLHCNVGSNTGHEAYAPCTLDDLRSAGIDYWALGHVHARQVLSEKDPVIVYPGNPQGRQPNEVGERGVYLVEADGSGRVSLAFHAIDVVRWASSVVDVTGLDTEQDVFDAAEDAVDSLLAGADGRHVVYRLSVTGRGQLYQSTRREGFTSDLQEHLNDAYGARRPFAWCERINVSTSSPIDRAALLESGDFVSDLLRLIDEIRDSASLPDDLRGKLNDLYAHHRARKYLKDALPENEGIRALLDEAEARCLDELVAGGAP